MNASGKSTVKQWLNLLAGIAIVGFLVWGIGARVARTSFDTFVEVTPPSAQKMPDKPLAQALFWVEQELERIGRSSGPARQESDAVLAALESGLRACGTLLPDKLVKPSRNAVIELTRLGAGATPKGEKEPDGWQIAASRNAAYVFLAELTEITASKRGNDLNDATFRYQIRDIHTRQVLWEAKAKRISGFFSGRVPAADEQSRNVIGLLKASGWISESACK